MADKDGKTEKPTSIRRRQAEEKGNIAYSQQVASTLALIVGVVVLAWILTGRGGFRGLMAGLLDAGISKGDPQLIAVNVMHQAGLYFMLVVGPVLGSVWLGALAGNVLQGLPKFASKAFEPKWERLNPAENVKKFKTKISPVEWARVLVLLVVLGVVLWQTINGHWDDLMRSPGVSLEASNSLLWAMVVRVLIYVLLTLGVLAAIDFFVQRHRYEESLKMTKSEVKQDNKQMEGSPEVKNKVRSIQRQQAGKRMMAAIADADVIITNPTHFAVALEYKPDAMGAPRVVAKGQDWLAQKIKKVGREYDIPQVENVPLARSLYRSVEVGQEIPMHLYKAVAEVLAYVFRIRKNLRRKG